MYRTVGVLIITVMLGFTAYAAATPETSIPVDYLQFLGPSFDMGVGARAMGMAGAVAFLPTEPCDTFWSVFGVIPKGVRLEAGALDLETTTKLITGVTNWQTDIEGTVRSFYGAAAIRLLGVPSRKMFTLGLFAAGAGTEAPDMPLVDDSGNKIGEFSAKSLNAKAGASVSFGPLQAGASYNLYRVETEGIEDFKPYEANTVSGGAELLLPFDIKISASPERYLPINLALGAIVKDVYLETPEEAPLGASIIVGGGVKVGRILAVEVGVEDLIDYLEVSEIIEKAKEFEPEVLRAGAEIGIGGALFLRGGTLYNLKESKFVNYAFGVGLKLGILAVGYSGSLNLDAKFPGVHRLSVTLSF